MNRSILLTLVALVCMAGCTASTSEIDPDDDSEEAEAQLSQDQRDQRNAAKIKTAATKDLDAGKVTFSSRVKAPSQSAGSGARAESASLYGVDWFQQWSGGVNANHDWSKGTEFGKRCMWAAVYRFEAIMKDPPEEFRAFRGQYRAWSGSFYNWVDDYSGKSESGQAAYGDASGARLWAWRTGLTKWISQTGKDGACYLPTRKMLVDYVKACNEHQASNDGQMEGCEAR